MGKCALDLKHWLLTLWAGPSSLPPAAGVQWRDLLADDGVEVHSFSEMFLSEAGMWKG